jgi:hypothetical protein
MDSRAAPLEGCWQGRGLVDEIQNDFGDYLSAIAEKDMDLLFLEELHVSLEFVEWLCSRVNISEGRFHGAWHSVCDSDGETDLLVRVKGVRVTGILIENKIGAAEQVMQADRYRVRGLRAKEQGKFEEFTTCICAPQMYLDDLSSQSVYDHRIPYEEIAEWFRKRGDARSLWKSRLVEQAILKSRRGYTMAVNRVITQFHSDYWDYRAESHPDLLMKKPGPKGSKSSWIILRGADFPKGVHFHHKLDQCVVELGFDGRSLSDLRAVLPGRPGKATFAEKGKTAVLSLKVPLISMEKGVFAQRTEIDAAFSAMRTLLPYASVFQEGGLTRQ